MTYFWTADEHYGHRNIITYCDRPFSSVEEMDETIIQQHNAVVKDGDKVIHVGDFTLGTDATRYIRRLRGKHTFLRGSHDRWLEEHASAILETKIDGQLIVACHYAMRTWPKSHYNSWQLYGHSHGRLPPVGKQHDVGVDNNDFTPVSYDQLRAIMATRDDNPNLVQGRK